MPDPDAGERDALRKVVRAFLEECFPLEATRERESGAGLDRAAWSRVARELDVLGLDVPETLGGQGADFADVLLVAEELGRVLAPAPFVTSAVLATTFLAHQTDETGHRLVPGLVEGDVVAAVVLDGDVRASGDGIATTLSGEAAAVAGALGADLLVVPVADADGTLRAYVVETARAAVTCTPVETLDRTRVRARVVLDAAPGTPLLGDAAPALDLALARATVALGAEAVGAAAAAFDRALSYVLVRRQFSRPVGEFQAVQHRLADLWSEVASARASVRWAAGRTDPVEARHAASLVKVRTAEALAVVARETLHLHGGIGFTWEHPAHLYLKRSLGDRALFGTPAEHRRRLAEGLGNTVSPTLRQGA